MLFARGRGVGEHGAVASVTGIAARCAVGVDDDFHEFDALPSNRITYFIVRHASGRAVGEFVYTA